MAATDYALVVGINAYSRLRPLAGPEQDAIAFEQWLRRPDGGDVPNVERILSSDYPVPQSRAKARPWTEDIRTYFQDLVDRADPQLRVGRRLYLFLAGHGSGYPNDATESALLMANASATNLQHVPGVKYVRALRGSTLFAEIVLFMDCCRDIYASDPPYFDLGLERIAVPGAAPAHFFAFATKWSYTAREGPTQDGTVRGHFTRALIEALERPGSDSASVRDYVKGRLPQLAPENDYQRPDFDPPDGREPLIVFGGAASAGAPKCRVTVAFLAPDAGVLLVLKENEKIVARRQMAGGDWEIELDPGLYEITGSDGRKSTGFRVPAAEAFRVEL